MNRSPVIRGFHEGELAVQQQAGVREDAARLRRMLDPPDLTGGATRFLAGQSFAVLSGRDQQGRLWISALTGPQGFLEAFGTDSVAVHTAPAPGDPLHGLLGEQPVGMLVIDFAKRRRFRLNGWLSESGRNRLLIEADQAYGNCPQYIQQRDLKDAAPRADDSTPGQANRVERPLTRVEDGIAPDGVLSEADLAQIGNADTFFLGTTHPSRGADASHRGGPSGFVRTTSQDGLWWPDYPGNNMFNSFGNLAVDPTAALLFYDFATGRTLHISGSAHVQRTTPGAAGDDARTGRRVEFSAEHSVLGPAVLLRSDATAAP